MNALTANTMIAAAKTLTELLDTLREIEADMPRDDAGGDYAVTMDSMVQLDDLPHYGGTEPADTVGVWSWDETHLLVGDGSWCDAEIEPRCVDIDVGPTDVSPSEYPGCWDVTLIVGDECGCTATFCLGRYNGAPERAGSALDEWASWQLVAELDRLTAAGLTDQELTDLTEEIVERVEAAIVASGVEPRPEEDQD